MKSAIVVFLSLFIFSTFASENYKDDAQYQAALKKATDEYNKCLLNKKEEKCAVYKAAIQKIEASKPKTAKKDAANVRNDHFSSPVRDVSLNESDDAGGEITGVPTANDSAGEHIISKTGPAISPPSSPPRSTLNVQKNTTLKPVALLPLRRQSSQEKAVLEMKKIQPSALSLGSAKKSPTEAAEDIIEETVDTTEASASENADKNQQIGMDQSLEVQEDQTATIVNETASAEDLQVIHTEVKDCTSPTWFPGISSKVIAVQSPCSANERIPACIRFVQCTKGEKKFLRQALCAPAECKGDNDAQKCLSSNHAIYLDEESAASSNKSFQKNGKSLKENVEKGGYRVKAQ